MSELKPCPFCGGEAFVSARLPYFGEQPTVAVVCEDCNAASKHKAKEKDAIEAWNRRADTMRDNFADMIDDFLGVDSAYFGVDKYELADYLIANGVTVQEWISVKDRLPEKDERVLTYRPGQFYEMVVVSFDGYNWERWDTCGGTSEKLITHWMPLPQPPKGE